jgi:ribosome assembly protein RRB1
MDIDSLTDVEERAIPFMLRIDAISKGDALEADDSVYIIRHALKIGWSSLSFDILRDNLGDERQRLPTAACAVAGSQADWPGNNTMPIFKLSSLHHARFVYFRVRRFIFTYVPM